MKLSPLGTQRNLETDFDEIDYSGPDGSNKGLLKSYFKTNRRYNGIYLEVEGETVTLYYYSLSSNTPVTLDISVYVALGYDKYRLLRGLDHPLFICKDVYEFNGAGKFNRIHHEESLLTGAKVTKLLKMYLDPYLFKPTKIEYVETEDVEFNEYKHLLENY
jgi:hypothetical protein